MVVMILVLLLLVVVEYVCAYVHVIEHVCGCAGICTHVHTCRGQSRTLSVFYDPPYLIALRQASSLDQKPIFQPGWPAIELLGFSFCSSPGLVS